MASAGNMEVEKNMKTKKTIINIIKTHKFISGVLGLFLAIVGTWTAIKGFARKDITGEWKIKFTNEHSSYKPYIGETHVQKIFFTQNEKNVTGEGEKIQYNGEDLPSAKRRQLEYKGTIDDNKLVATYSLHGQLRESIGIIQAIISNDGKTLSGTFSGTAGSAEGTLTGERIN